jgi:mannose-6-phosphate isomerase-like protein (cupin superfamily)
MKPMTFSNEHALGRLLLSAFQPEFLPPHERRMQAFRFREPDLRGKMRAVVRLATTDIFGANIQVLNVGEAEGMHLHAAMDGLWMVLKGATSFVGEDGVEIPLGPLEGIMVPRGVPYAFKQVGDEPLVLLQAETLVKSARRNTYQTFDAPGSAPRPELDTTMDLYDARIDDAELRAPGLRTEYPAWSYSNEHDGQAPQRVAFDDSNPLGRLLLSGIQPELMPKHERAFQVFRFKEPPVAAGTNSALVRLATTDIVGALIQVLPEGGEVGMHLHAAMDGLWLVLKGGVSILGEDGIEHEFGPMEGMMIPRGVPYAFKKIGPETLVLLQIESLVSTARRNTFKWIDAPGAPPPDAEDVRKTDVPMELFDARVA